MIDLSALGLPSVPTSSHGKNEKAGTSHEQGKEAKSFGDLVKEAGKKSGGKNAAGDDAAAETHAFKIDNLEARGKQVPDLTAALKADPRNIIAASNLDDKNTLQRAMSLKTANKSAADATSTPKPGDKSAARDTAASKAGGKHATHAVGTSKAGNSGQAENTDAMIEGDDAGVDVDFPETDSVKTETTEPGGRVQLSAGLQQLMKSGAMSGVLHRADDGKDEVKGGKIENNHEQKLSKDDASAVKDKAAASPSEELHALLGMAPPKDDSDAVEKPAEKPVKASGHAGDDDKAVDAKPVKDGHGHADDAAATEAKSGVPDAQVAAQSAAVRLPDGAGHADAGDDAPKDGDIDKLRAVANDGKGRPADIELSKSANHERSESAAGKTDFVTVLDSRRYLGFTTDSSNTAALTSAIKAEPSWAQVMHNVNTGAGQTATEVNTLKLQMNPEHLGNMTASLRLKGDELSVEVRVETVDAYRQLSKDQDSIVKALKDQGFSIDQVSIQLSPSARSDAGQGSASQNNGSQSQSGSSGQNLQQGGQGDNARQRDEGARRTPNQNNWIGNDPTSTLSDSGIGRNNTDSGNLYL